MTTRKTFFPYSIYLPTGHNSIHRTHSVTLPDSEPHQNQSPFIVRKNNNQSQSDTRKKIKGPETWARENDAPPFPLWNDFLQNISTPLPPILEYSGKDHEDSRRFLSEMTIYFRVTNRNQENWL